MRVSAKTRSWEQAESLARKYEITAEGGDEIKEARTLPTVKEAVKGYLSDAEARGLSPATIQKLEHVFRKQLLAFTEQHRIIFLRDVNVRNMTEWRSTWVDKPLARKKKFERVVGFFWFCVRHGWLTVCRKLRSTVWIDLPIRFWAYWKSQIARTPSTVAGLSSGMFSLGRRRAIRD
jgi:hypothetical protein